MKPFSGDLPQLWFELEHYSTLKLDAHHFHEWYTNRNTLLYLAEGEGTLQDVLGEHKLNAGDFFFYPKEERIKLTSSRAGCLIIRKIEFDCVRINRREGAWKMHFYKLPFWGRLHSSSPTITQHLMEKLCLKLEYRNFPMESTRDRALFYQMWEYMEKSTKKQRANEDMPLYHIAEMLREHVKEKFIMEELANKAGLNISEFFKRFKHEYGTSPGQYHTEQRLRKSLEMLTGSSLKISEIAHNVGYEDEYYFSRVFKKKLGVSPAEFIKKARKKVLVVTPKLKDIVQCIGIKPLLLNCEGASPYSAPISQEIEDKNLDYILIPPEYAAHRQELSRIAPVYILSNTSMAGGVQQLLPILKLEVLEYEWLLSYHVNEKNENRQVSF
ncbi:helix-turn-helix domain-containing protein [Paenibacillus pinistramenti]|uniref:helix-turn-helix domain-containing protein n=1 Tax=Paenibacillus pinistramenti TaxID=1768003 RepID=UPI0011080C70|nr:AraC family transcriptional regulator [Paenibacillus pinistramenti]